MSNGKKVAVITGASQGIGAALVDAYLDRNYSVVATSRSIQPSSNPDLLAVAGDIGHPDTGPRVVAAALEKFGRIDTLVNNAGIFVANRSPIIRRSNMPMSFRRTSTASTTRRKQPSQRW